MLYEHIVWDWHLAREIAPRNTVWQWLRVALSAVLAFIAVASIVLAGGREASEQSDRQGLVAGWLAMGAVGLISVILILDPQLYFSLGAEDGFVEWVSAGALLFASFCCLRWLLLLGKQVPRNRLHSIAAGSFVALFFVMAMEEISWGQRIIGFATPESIAGRNWQNEYNLHNMQTDLTELATYVGTGLFLVVAPLVRANLRHWPLVAPVSALLPDRTVALVSAPMLALTYARFDLLPMQAVYFGGLAVCLWFARSAAAAGRRHEARAFASVSAVLIAVQIVHLLYGRRMVQVHDPSEFREAVMAVGIGWYGWRQWLSARA